MINNNPEFQTQVVTREILPDSREERLREGVKIWTSFYRKNPARFFQDYFGLKLHPYQVFMFQMMNNNSSNCYITTRGLGKSYTIAAFLVTMAVLFPNLKIIVSCETIDQASQLVKEKIQNELMGKSSNLRREIIGVKSADKGIKVEFKNNSFIEAINADPSTRGRRCHILVVDEYVLVKGGVDTLNNILRPFMQVSRQAPYMEKAEYKHLIESNKEILLTSGWYTSHWSYDVYEDFRKKMFEGKKFHVSNFSYHLGKFHNMIPKEQVEKIEELKRTNLSNYIMEYGGMFYKLTEGSYISSNDFMNARRLIKSWYPPSDIEYIEESKKEFKKRSYYLPRKDGELRVLSCDIAMLDSTKTKSNDASVYTILSCVPKDERYIIDTIYQESHTGMSANNQALLIKRLFHDCECDYLVIDCLTIGISVLDALGEYTEDRDRDITYEPLKCFNNKELADRCGYKNAKPLIFGYRGTAESNSEMAVLLRTSLENKSLNFLVNEREAEEYLIKHRDYKKLSPQKQANLLMPYVNTTLMQNEVCALESEIVQGKYIKVKEVGRNTKDRYSSLAMGVYVVKKEFENKLKKPKRSGDLPMLW